MSKNQYSRNLAVEEEAEDGDIIRVSAGSDPQGVAASISNAFYDRSSVTMRAVGASAVNQAVKTIAIARGYIAPKGHDLVCRPGFINIPSYGDDTSTISAIVFRLSLE